MVQPTHSACEEAGHNLAICFWFEKITEPPQKCPPTRAGRGRRRAKKERRWRLLVPKTQDVVLLLGEIDNARRERAPPGRYLMSHGKTDHFSFDCLVVLFSRPVFLKVRPAT